MLSVRVPLTGEVVEFASVRAYLASPHWAWSRLLWRARHRDAECFICGNRDFDLHHLTYERAGVEDPTDLVPLCEDHHHEVEKLVARGEARRLDAHEVLRARYALRAGRRTHEPASLRPDPALMLAGAGGAS